MLELQVQPVARVGVELGLELDAVPVDRVHVQVGEVALAQRDQVAAGAEVGLGLDGLAVAGDRRSRACRRARRSSTVYPSVVSTSVRSGSGAVVGVAVDGQVGRQRLVLAALEVGEDAVGARVGQRDLACSRCRPAASVGCRCWKPVPSRRTTIRCIRFSCSTSKSRTGPSAPSIVKRSVVARPRGSEVAASESRRPSSATARPRTASAACPPGRSPPWPGSRHHAPRGYRRARRRRRPGQARPRRRRRWRRRTRAPAAPRSRTA